MLEDEPIAILDYQILMKLSIGAEGMKKKRVVFNLFSKLRTNRTQVTLFKTKLKVKHINNFIAVFIIQGGKMCGQNLDNFINRCSTGAALLHLDNAFIFQLECIICCF